MGKKPVKGAAGQISGTGNRKAEFEGTAASRCVEKGEDPVVFLYDLLCDAEAKAEMVSVGAGGVAAEKALKYPFPLPCRDPGTVVDDRTGKHVSFPGF